MALNPLAPVTDGQTMLNRIAWFSSAATLAAVWLMRRNSDLLDQLLHERVDLVLEAGGEAILPLPGGYLLPALAMGLLSRVFRLHGQLSDWLGIGERFDVEVIIPQLAARTGVDLSGVPDHVLVARRREIMRHSFYPHVSGTQPVVDEGLVHQALDAWSWFWIGLEATCVFVMTGMALLAAGSYNAGVATVFAAIGIALVGLPALRNQCKRYAIAQVRAICDDPQRALQVRRAIAGGSPGQVPRRRRVA